MANERDFYGNRKYIVGAIIVLVALIYLTQLFRLQVIDQSAKSLSTRNVLKTEIRFPARGLIYDRNNQLIVYNKAAYDLSVVPREIKPFDTLDLCTTLNVTKEKLIERLTAARKYSRYKQYVILSQLTALDYARLQEKMFLFPGFYVQQRTQRAYNYQNAGHVLGYIGEVNSKDINKDEYYFQGDYIGKIGIEKTYEKSLRGVKGKRFLLKDSRGAIKGSYQNGESDVMPVPGKDLILSLDIDLQVYGEKLMQNKIGSIVAIEPSTGEILAFISSPEYDPSILVGRQRGENYQALANDTLKPLNNRALQGTYSPGSTFKLINAAIGLQEGAITPFTRFSCEGPVSYPIKCTHNHFTPLGSSIAIETSCNPFFYKTFKQILERPGINTRDGYQRWYDHVRSFGFGERLGIDLPYEIKGNVPKKEYFDRYYGKTGWKAITVRSLAIGQGELLVTPLQMANEGAALANRGYYFRPHLVKSIENESITDDYLERINTSIEPQYYEEVVKGMSLVYTGEIGTARYFKNDTITMCGKTGTVQNPFGEDHSVFIAFAPRENPQIAICVVVENAGFGSTWAAPMATLMMEKYISGTIPPRHKYFEDKMFNANFITHEQE